MSYKSGCWLLLPMSAVFKFHESYCLGGKAYILSSPWNRDIWALSYSCEDFLSLKLQLCLNSYGSNSAFKNNFYIEGDYSDFVLWAYSIFFHHPGMIQFLALLDFFYIHVHLKLSIKEELKRFVEKKSKPTILYAGSRAEKIVYFSIQWPNHLNK